MATSDTGGGLSVAMPTRLARLLADARPGRLRELHRGAHALYLELDLPTGPQAVGLLARGAAPVPCGAQTTADRLPQITRVDLVDGWLSVDGVPVRVTRLVDTRTPRLSRTLPPSMLSETELHDLIGAGGGLTPYGDDVVCGWLAMHRAVGTPTPEVDAAVRALLHRTTTFSATMLDYALAGHAIAPFGRWLRALDTPAEAEAERRLRAIGHTSGAGMLAGARRALTGSDRHEPEYRSDPGEPTDPTPPTTTEEAA